MVPILKLNLSYNRFGSEGLKNLAVGLSENNTLEELTLNYCDINYEGALYLQEVLSYHDSKIEVLYLLAEEW